MTIANCLLLLFPAVLAGAPNVLELIKAGSHEALVAALKGGADANTKDGDEVAALSYAAVYANSADMKALLAHGAKVNAVDKWGGTALMASIGDPDKVRLLLEAGADVNLGRDGEGALTTASRLQGGEEVVQMLMARGAKPNPAVLRRAALEGRMKLVELSLAAGVDAKTVNLGGVTDVTMLKLLLKNGASQGKDNALMNSAYFGASDMVRVLLDNGAGVTATDSRQRSAIHYAAGSDYPQVEIVKMLLAAGADPKAKDTRGDTALDWAKFRGDDRMIQMLGGAPKHGDVYEVAHGPLAPVNEAVQRAVRVLEAAGPSFFKKNACISCHNQSIPQMANGHVRERGIALDAKVTAAQIQAVVGVWTGHKGEMWRSDCRMGGGRVATMTYGLVGLGAEKVPLGDTLALASHCLTVEQRADGSWQIPDLRPPLGMSTVKYTALGLRGLQLYSLPGRKEEYASRVARARAYLAAAATPTTQDLAYKILGLKWAGASGAEIEPLARELVRLQRMDGGWPQRKELASDAFSTAQVVWALHEGAGRPVTDGPWKKGAEYLRFTQQADGSWKVHSRGFGFQPYRETGFPYGHDQWLSTAATGYAVIALAPLL